MQQKDGVRVLLNLSGLAQVFQAGFGGKVAALGTAQLAQLHHRDLRGLGQVAP